MLCFPRFTKGMGIEIHVESDQKTTQKATYGYKSVVKHALQKKSG